MGGLSPPPRSFVGALLIFQSDSSLEANRLGVHCRKCLAGCVRFSDSKQPTPILWGHHFQTVSSKEKTFSVRLTLALKGVSPVRV